MKEDNPLEQYKWFAMYANVPANQRNEYIEISEGGLLPLNDIYHIVAKADDEIRKLTEKKRMLIADTSKYIREHQA